MFVAGPGKHAFELICDPRIGKVSRDAAVAPGIIVLPVAKLGSGVAAVADALPRPMLARVAESRAAVVFDASGEGAVHTPERTAELHAFARRAGISPGRCAYLTQDRGYGEAYAAHCAALGLSPMAVLAYDHFIRRFFQGCEDDGAAVLEARLRAFEARGAARPRRFISLNLSPRPTKLLLLLGLIHAGLWERGFISFPGFDKARNNFAVSYKNSLADIAALPGFEDLAEEMAAHAPALAALGPMFVGELRRSKTREGHIKPPVTDTPMPEHDLSWFTIVPETEMEGPRRVTEKPFKSLVNFHPSIILGNAGSLALVREFGFRTFDGYVDEAYDAEADPRRRFDMVYAEVRRLCALPEAEMHKLERDFAETLAFNAEWGLTRLPALYRDRIDVELVDRLLALLEPERPPAPRARSVRAGTPKRAAAAPPLASARARTRRGG